MGQQISVEAALAAFRQRCSELSDENVLLKARADELEAELDKVRPSQQAAAPDEYPEPQQSYAGVDVTE